MRVDLNKALIIFDQHNNFMVEQERGSFCSVNIHTSTQLYNNNQERCNAERDNRPGEIIDTECLEEGGQVHTLLNLSGQ